MKSLEESIFDEALAIESDGERESFLLSKCAGRPELLMRVRELLSALQQGTFLEEPSTTVPAKRPFAEDLVPGKILGPYHLKRLIGQGGMGAVYQAEQYQPVRRSVALKVMRPDVAGQNAVDRFRNEQRTLALMDHPNIARVLDVSISADGIPYLVMELVDGAPIADYCESKELAVDSRLSLFLSCCQAIQHAHQKGIIHRDIKPSNVLVAEHDGVPIVKVIDFGIAKAFAGDLRDEDTGVNLQTTHAGELLGTPHYMSPEQASLGAEPIDTRSDIYSLGAMLYSILTGKRLFESEMQKNAGFDEIRRVVRTVDPPVPSHRIQKRLASGETAAGAVSMLRKRRLRIAGDLDAIVMMALEKDKARRYQSVSELIRDLQSFLSDQPILARRSGSLDGFRKLIRRHRTIVLTAILAVAYLLGMLYFALDREFKTREALLTAKAEEQKALAAERQFRELLYATDTRTASGALRDHDEATAARHLNRHVPTGRDPDIRSFDWQYVAARSHSQRTEFLDDGRHLAVGLRNGAGTMLEASGEPGQDYTLRRLFSRPLHEDAVSSLVGSHDGESVIAVGGDGRVSRSSRRDMLAVPEPTESDIAFKVQIASNEQVLMTQGGNLQASYLPLSGKNGEERRMAKEVELIAPVITASGHVFAGAELRPGRFEFQQLIRWTADFSTSEVIWSEQGQNFADVFSVSNDERFVALHVRRYTEDFELEKQELVILNLKTGSEILRAESPGYNGFVFSPDSRLLAASAPESVMMMDPALGQKLYDIHIPNLNSVAFSPDNLEMALVTGDRELVVCRTVDGSPIHSTLAHGIAARGVAYSPDGFTIATVGEDGYFRCWRRSIMEMTLELKFPAALKDVGFTPDSRTAVIVDSDKKLYSLQSQLRTVD